MDEVNVVVGGISSNLLLIEVDACLLVVVEAERGGRLCLDLQQRVASGCLSKYSTFLCPVSHDRRHDNDVVKQRVLVLLLTHLIRESRLRAIATWKQPPGNLDGRRISSSHDVLPEHSIFDSPAPLRSTT